MRKKRSNGCFAIKHFSLRELAPLKALLLMATLFGAAATSYATTLEFNGANDYVVATAPNLTVTTNLTLEAWVNPQTATANTILTRGGGGSGNTDFIGQLTSAGKLAFWGVGIWDFSNSTVPLNEWTHVAVTYDGLEKSSTSTESWTTPSAGPVSCFKAVTQIFGSTDKVRPASATFLPANWMQFASGTSSAERP